MEPQSLYRCSRREFVMGAAAVSATHAFAQGSASVAGLSQAIAAGGAAGTGGSGSSRYEQLSPKQRSRIVERCPVAYVSAGIVEWHGEQSACGLDGLKAESLCWMAAELLGGVCFPHVWLGPDASTPFDPTKYPRGTVTIDKALYHAATEQLLTQIEAMGFRAAVYLSGHYPGVIPEVAEAFNRRGKMKVISVSENLVVRGMPAGDHAATWETSLLKVLRPGLVDLTRLPALPPDTKPAGEVIPPAWKFRQRREYYGVYGSDPRVWTNAHFGRRGTEAVLDGLAREVGEALGDSSYGQGRRGVSWPLDSRQHPEVRYDYQLPYQWLRRFEQAPIVYVPLPAGGEGVDSVLQRAVDGARKTGGMVFPPLSYGPREDGQGVGLSAEVFGRVVREVVADLADMDFRVVVLLPAAELAGEVRSGLGEIEVAGGQSRVVVVDPSERAAVPSGLDDAVKAMVPVRATRRSLDGEWCIDGRRTVGDLAEAGEGSGDERTYEHTFDLTRDEAGRAVLLDLGQVDNHCEVVVNDAPPLTDHWPPYRFLLTGRVKPGANRLKIVVRHQPQETLDRFFYRPAPPRLKGPVILSVW